MHEVGNLSGSDRDGNRSPGSALRSLDLDGTEGAVLQGRFSCMMYCRSCKKDLLNSKRTLDKWEHRSDASLHPQFTEMSLKVTFKDTWTNTSVDKQSEGRKMDESDSEDGTAQHRLLK